MQVKSSTAPQFFTDMPSNSPSYLPQISPGYEGRENFIKELLNINVNFRNFDIKLYFIIIILSLNDDNSIFNVTLKLGYIMESFFIQNLKKKN